jgi:hypothetical protein
MSLQHVDELLQEERNPVLELRFGGARRPADGNLGAAALNQILLVLPQELVENSEAPSRNGSARRMCRPCVDSIIA